MSTRRGLTQDIGATGLAETWGYIKDDFLSEWQGTEKWKRIDEMIKNSPVVAAIRLAIEMSIRSAEWYLEGEDENPRAFELVDEAWQNMSHSWNDHVSDAMLMPFYGMGLFSIVYKREGGRMMWRKFKMLPADTIMRWDFAGDDGIDGLWQYPHLYAPYIPVERVLLYRFRRNRGNPEGESILRPAWVPWWYVKNLQQIEAIGIERNMNGLPIITPPMGADMTESTSTTSDYGRAHQIIRNARQDEQAGIILPAPTGDGEHQRWHFDLMSGGGMSKAIDSSMVIQRYEKRMLMACLSQFLILGQDSVGALATFEGGAGFFTQAVDSIADSIAETFSKYAIPRLCKLNGLDSEGVQLSHTSVGEVDLEKLGTFISVTGDKITWTPDDEIWLRASARLPEIEREELERIQGEAMARREAERAASPLFGRAPVSDDQMGVDWYDTATPDNAPDDDERRKMERLLVRNMKRYLTGQEKLVLDGVEEMTGGQSA